jgi:hypothetical protein
MHYAGVAAAETMLASKVKQARSEPDDRSVDLAPSTVYNTNNSAKQQYTGLRTLQSALLPAVLQHSLVCTALSSI